MMTLSPMAKPLWAYAYEIVPAQADERLRALKKLLDAEHFDAQRDDRTWSGRVVSTLQVTHILIVSDSPDQRLAVNHRIEVALRALKAGFSITASLAVDPDLPKH
jgi:hypothetical protein